MAHTAKYLEGALYEILFNNMTSFGVNVVDGYQEDVIPLVTNTIGPASAITARIRMDGVEWNKVNTLAALTVIQLVTYHIDCWGEVTDGVNREDQDGGLPARIWQLTTGLSEAANVGDIGWSNILLTKVLNVGPVTYETLGIPKRTLHCAATWN